nr:transglycosylase family protein [Nocardia stercoris]
MFAIGSWHGSSPAHALPFLHDWEGVARCESGGNWRINTGNGYYGGLQFSLATWRSYGGFGLPSDSPKNEQIRVAELVLVGQGVKAWPVCGRFLRDANPLSFLNTGSG